ncbi:5'-AMP-activated protein kinase subunit gamma [Sphaerulina musiva]
MEDERNLETALADEAAGNTDVPREGHGPASQVVASAAAAGDEVADGHEDNSKAPLAPPDHHQQHANFAAAHNPAGHAPAAAAGAASHLPFVAPSDLLRVSQFRPASRASSASASVRSRPGTASSADTTARASKPMPYQDREQIEGLRAIRAFLKVRTSYDVLPLSYRLIVFDTSLLVKKSLNILTQCAIVSAPLWDSKTSAFAGLLTVSDYINVVQYYWQNQEELGRIDKFKLSSLRDIERAIGVTPIETVSIHPLQPLYEACRRMLGSRARRIPLIDKDDETGQEMVVSVITQYRILKFISVNVKETQMLRKPLRELNVGSYTDLATATMDTPVMDCIQMLVKKSISSVPILDKDGTVLNVFESVDVITLIKGGDYENLNLTVGQALDKRSDDFPGIYTCTLSDRMDTIYDTIRKSRVHRLVVIDEENQLKGLLSLSDILDYTLNSPLGDSDD